MSIDRDALFERMANHIRKAAAVNVTKPNALYGELMEIAALLPDGDVLEARRVIEATYGNTRYQDGRKMGGDGPARVEDIAEGKGDDYWEAKCVVAGIKRGCELERIAHKGLGE